MAAPESGMEQIFESVKRALVRAEQALKKMHSSDLDGAASHGLNECGFKFIFVASLDGDYLVESERDVEGGRVDLIISDLGGENVLVIEFKYIRLGFMVGCKCGTADNFYAKHKKFNVFAAELLDMSSAELKRQTYRTPSAKYRSVAEEKTEAFDQVGRYANALKNGTKDPLPKTVKHIETCVIIGVGNRILSFKKGSV
jgi:hypothetical protein